MFVDLGLTDLEETVHQALLRQPASTSELRLGPASPTTPEAVASALQRLSGLGLVVCLPTEPELYVAVPRDAALTLLLAQRERAGAVADTLVAQLAAQFGRAATPPEAYDQVEVIVGLDECHQGFRHVLRSATREVRACESAYSLRQGVPVDDIVKKLIGSGIRFRALYDAAGFESPHVIGVEKELAAGEEARIVNVPVKMVLTDHPLGWVEMRLPSFGDYARLLVRDPFILAALSALFEMLWEQALPLAAAGGGRPPEEPDVSAAGDRTLARLLAAGLSEQTIAEYLGCHERTARHRIRAMMTRLDAHTPFQAGYQSVRRGLLTDEDHSRALG